MRDLEPFFNPKSIAVVGASPKKNKLGNILIENIQRAGWRGKLFYVNPSHSRIGKSKCYANLSEVKQRIDLALVAIPALAVKSVIEDGIKARPKISNFVVISSGFKEIGKEGKRREEKLSRLAKRHSINILGPNCLGFINSKAKLNATFASGGFKSGKVAIVSQSGALAVALLDWAKNASVGFSKVVSIGNKADLDESHIINHLIKDNDTRVIAIYLEDIKNGREFVQAVGKAAQKKPVVVLKAGRTEAGKRAVSSHTGSLAQDEEVIRAIFNKLNIIVAENISEFQNLIKLLSSEASPEKKEVIVVTNAGGPGVLASDCIGKSKDLKLLKFTNDFRKKIKKLLPIGASEENPIDILGDADPDRYKKALDQLSAKYKEYPLLVILTPQSQTDPDQVAKIISRHKDKFSSVAACFMGGVKINKAKNLLGFNGVANFDSPGIALRTLEKVVRYRFGKSKRAIGLREQPPIAKVSPCIKKALGEKRKVLFWEEVNDIFKKYGLPLAKSIIFDSLEKLNTEDIFYPCVLKTNDPKIIHRWEKKGVILNIQDEEELKSAFQRIKKSTNASRFLIQPMLKTGLELIIGMKRDKTFGPVIICGAGGTYAEILKDRLILIPPLGANAIKKKISGLKIYPVLKGFRGESGYDLNEIAKILLAVENMTFENPQVSEIDINPLMIYNDGSQAQILDAKVYLN